jgi:hypothetical protein
MSDTAVFLPFGDGEYRFWLPLPEVVELERKTGSSIIAIEERLRAAIGADGSQDDPVFVFLGGGAATVADVRETLRLALQGGGGGLVDGQEVEVGPNMARQLIDAYVYPARPLSEGVVVAWRVLHAALHGVQLKKKLDEQVARETPSESLSEKDS